MIALVTTESARGYDKDLGILSRALDVAGVKWNIVNWDNVAKRFEAARSNAGASLLV